MTPEQRSRQPVFRNQLPPEEETAPQSKVDFIGYFRNHIDVSLTPGEKKPFKGKILPSFDWSVSVVDTEFKKSYIPYRDDLGSYAGFFLIAWVHSFFGNSQNRFISPLTWSNLAYIPGDDEPDKADPVNDMQDFVFKDETKRYAHLLARKRDGSAPPLTRASERVFFNAYGRRGTESDPKLTIIDMSASSRKNLLNNKLAALRPADVKVWDKNYPEYLFGDVTDPRGGAVVRSVAEITTSGTNTYKYTALAFNENNVLDNTEGMRSYACMELLEKRHNLWSADMEVNPLIILSYQQLVDFIIADGFMPIELVKEACSYHADIGANPRGPIPPRNVPKAAPYPDDVGEDPREVHKRRLEEDMAIAAKEQEIKEQARKAKAREDAARAAATADEKKYFATCKGLFDVVEKPESEIQKLLNEGYVVKLYVNDKWISNHQLDTLGFKLPKPPEPKREEAPKRPPPPPPDDDDDLTDTYVAPMVAPKPAPPPPPPPPEDDTPENKEVLTDLDADDLELLKVGYAMYRGGKGKVEATPDFSAEKVNRFLMLFMEYNEDGSFKTT